MSDGPPRVTRRGFLAGLGAVAGAGAVLGAMEALDLAPRVTARRFSPPAMSDFALQGRANDTTVLVLGAGVAGLAAAYELEKAGYRCEVLEARDRPGGRSWTVRAGTTETEIDGPAQTAGFAEGVYFNPGPARIPQHHVTLDYCRELGVPVEVFANSNADAWYYHEQGEAAAGPLTGTRVRQRAARADLYGGVAELLAKAAGAGALDDRLSATDREALLAFLAGFGALADGNRYVGSPRRGDGGAPFDLSALLASDVGVHVPFDFEWDQAMPMFQPVGGMDRLPFALAEALRGPIRYGAEVTGITLRDGGVDVAFSDGTAERRASAGHCICTLPPMTLARVTTNLPTEVTQALAQAIPVPTGKVGLQYRRRFWETDERIFGGITWTNLDIGTIWYPSHGYLGQRGLVVGAYNFVQEAEAFAALGPAERERRTVEQGMRIHGAPYRDELEASFSVSWSRVRHSEGGWVAWDQFGPPPSPLLQPVGRLVFAGDHLHEATSWQHGALESARAAVTALHERVLTEG